jgi:hypothetical protein
MAFDDPAQMRIVLNSAWMLVLVKLYINSVLHSLGERAIEPLNGGEFGRRFREAPHHRLDEIDARSVSIVAARVAGQGSKHSHSRAKRNAASEASMSKLTVVRYAAGRR